MDSEYSMLEWQVPPELWDQCAESPRGDVRLTKITGFLLKTTQGTQDLGVMRKQHPIR